MAGRKKITPTVEAAECTPLVDASMRNLYRDELFWFFHYPDHAKRVYAQAEYELYEVDLNDDETFEEWSFEE